MGLLAFQLTISIHGLLPPSMGDAGEPLLIDPRRFHSVVTASVVRFCFFRDLQHIGGTECGICVHEFERTFQSPLYYWWAAWVSIPAPED